uniref:C2H2-type domain-containing protein n=1 Tax=Strongyloides papillosus TaxID=174720 RepID=A0A0N5BI63_STREA
MVSCPICYNKNNDHVQLTLDHLKQHKHEKFVPIKCPYPGCDTKRFTQLL